MPTTREEFFKLLRKISVQIDRLHGISVIVRSPSVSIDIASITTELQNILTELQSQSTTLSSIDGNTDALESILQDVDDNTDGIEALLTTIDTSLNNIETDIDNIRTSNLAIETNTTGLGTQFSLALLVISNAAILSDTNNIQNAVEAIETEIKLQMNRSYGLAATIVIVSVAIGNTWIWRIVVPSGQFMEMEIRTLATVGTRSWSIIETDTSSGVIIKDIRTLSAHTVNVIEHHPTPVINKSLYNTRKLLVKGGHQIDIRIVGVEVDDAFEFAISGKARVVTRPTFSQPGLATGTHTVREDNID